MAYDLLLFGLSIHFHERVFGNVADFLGGRYFLDCRFGLLFIFLPPISCLFESLLLAVPVQFKRDDFEKHSPDVEPGK